MPTVTIVKPSNTSEQEKEVLKNIAFAMEQIYEEEYRAKVKVYLFIKEEN